MGLFFYFTPVSRMLLAYFKIIWEKKKERKKIRYQFLIFFYVGNTARRKKNSFFPYSFSSIREIYITCILNI